MKRMTLLFVLLLPFVELYLLIEIGSSLGGFLTVLWVIFTAVLGLFLLRSQGAITLFKVQQAMQRGEPVESNVFQGTFIFIGGLFLMFPGFITDGLGALMFLNTVRSFLADRLYQSGRFSKQSNVYETQWRRKDDQTHIEANAQYETVEKQDEVDGKKDKNQ